MGLTSHAVAVALFFAVPLALWVLGVAFMQRKGIVARALALVAGSDNRLSLSRLQAFAWTLVIFGSYAAAMAYHRRLHLAGTEAAKLAADSANALDSVAALSRAAFVGRIYANDTAGAKAAALEAQRYAIRASAAAEEAGSYKWIAIPGTLLILAGIAIGSGVLASLLSQNSGESTSGCVRAVSVVASDDPNIKTQFPSFAPPLSPYCLKILGAGLISTDKNRGSVRINRRTVNVPYWSDDGTVIFAELPRATSYTRLIVDTANGKLAYRLATAGKALNVAADDALAAASLAGQFANAGANRAAASFKLKTTELPPAPALLLGDFYYDYEWSDLFRDDAAPSAFSLMKFQMFGWTVIAIVLYAVHFLQNLTATMTTLPAVDQSLVILTGVSQAGYLGAKSIRSDRK